VGSLDRAEAVIPPRPANCAEGGRLRNGNAALPPN
jgi:hypothetical protein